MNFSASIRAGIALALVTVAAGPAAAQKRGQLPALAAMQPGLWEMRELGNPRAVPREMCLADPAIVMQLQHRDASCSRLVVANDARSATVHYTCSASGFGRTSIKVETARLARIETQGIDHNVPFDYRLELRRKGACAAGGRGG